MGRFEEILVIFFVGLLFFGPNKLTDIAKSLGSALNEFKKAVNPEGQNTQTTQAQPVNQPVYIQAVQAPAAPAAPEAKAPAANETTKTSA